jgi:uncharacterized caspase-like protein
MGAIRSALIGFLVFGSLGCATSLDPAKPPPRAERPTYSLGEKWIRNDGVYELIRIEDDRYIFSAGRDREIHLTRDLFPATVVKGVRTLVFSPPPPLPWPLEVGKVNTGSGVVVDLFGSSVFASRVVAYENVRVPAGTFKAFRISVDASYRRGADDHLVLTAWYAPELRQLVKTESRLFGTLNESGVPDRLRLQDFQVVALDQATRAPLRVALESPPDQAHVTGEALAVSGKATSGRGVVRVTVTLNAMEVARLEPPDGPNRIVRVDLSVTLRPGQNVLLVTATDASGETSQEARTVFFDPAQSASAPRNPNPRWLAMTDPGRFGGVRVAQAAPFEVFLATPLNQAHVEQDTVALAGVVSSPKGVTRVLVTVNGREVARLDEPTAPRSVPLNFPLALREGPNTIVLTASDNNGTHHQEVRTVHYERPAPLTLAIRYPEDRARVTDEVTVLAAIVTASRGIAQASVTLNGIQVHQQAEREPQKTLALAIPLTLRPGPNAIVLTAVEPDGTRRQDVRTVIYDKPIGAAPAAAPAAARTQPERWAVVIGAGRYEDPAIPRLRYTVADAEAMHEFLTGPGGFPPDHVLLLTDRTERKPTLRNLKWALGTFLARSARKDDSVFVFFAGHGAPEVDPRGLERDGIAKYLVPVDADLDDLYATALPMDELSTIFTRIEAERIVVLLDACYSGGAGGRTFLAKRTRATNLDDLFLERLTRAKGRAIVSAARPNEVSLELADLGHGLFTHYVLEGLKGAADSNGDAIVTVQELYEYVEREVAQRSRAVGGSQHPVLKGELEGPLPLVRVAR